jgi:hypothetical protein
MLNVEVLLVVIGATPGKPLDTKVILTEPVDDRWGKYALPHEILSNCHSSEQLASYLLRKHTGLQAMVNGVGWVPILQKSVLDDTDRTEKGYRCVGIPYLALLSNLLPLEMAKWYSLTELSQLSIYKDHLQVINHVLSEG